MLFGVQWYYWVILLVAIIIAIFAWSKALKSGKARREKLKKEAAIWKRDYELREKFTILTEEKLNSTEETELLHGVAMNIQVMLENATDMTESFNALPNEKKFIYALEYFDEDAKKRWEALTDKERELAYEWLGTMLRENPRKRNKKSPLILLLKWRKSLLKTDFPKMKLQRKSPKKQDLKRATFINLYRMGD